MLVTEAYAKSDCDPAELLKLNLKMEFSNGQKIEIISRSLDSLTYKLTQTDNTIIEIEMQNSFQMSVKNEKGTMTFKWDRNLEEFDIEKINTKFEANAILDNNKNFTYITASAIPLDKESVDIGECKYSVIPVIYSAKHFKEKNGKPFLTQDLIKYIEPRSKLTLVTKFTDPKVPTINIVSIIPPPISSKNDTLKCKLKDSIFKDQNGEVARISNIKECFGWYNRDEPDLSADGTCYLASEAQRKVAEQSKEYNTRLVGQRVFNLDYKKRTYIIEEDVTVGVPWLHYSVGENNVNDISKYKSNEDEIDLMSADSVLDFTLNSDITKADANKYFNKLLGLKFSKYHCSTEQNISTKLNTSNENNDSQSNSNKSFKEGDTIKLTGKLKYRSNWNTESLVPYYIAMNTPIEISGVDDLCGTDVTKLNKIDIFDRREQLYKQYIEKEIVITGKLDCPRGGFVIRDVSIKTSSNDELNNTSKNNQNVKNYDFCYKDPNPNFMLDDPTYCLAYFEEFGTRSGTLLNDEIRGLKNLKELFPAFSEQCNSSWSKPISEREKDGKETAQVNLIMILKHVVPVNNFKNNMDHCLRTITFYGDVIKKMNKSN